MYYYVLLIERLLSYSFVLSFLIQQSFTSKKLRNASQISERKKMKTAFAGAIVSIILAVSNVDAFSTSSSFSGSQVTRIQNNNNNGLVMEYIPSGMSKEQWKKMKESEKGKNKGKNLGKTGISTFKSRSFSDWQKAGGKNLFPGKQKH